MSGAEIIEWPEVRQHIGAVPAWIDAGRPCLIVTRRMLYRTSAGQIIIVPAGYVTDLASVPRWLWFLIPPHGELMTAAILHDWLFSHGGEYLGVSREQSNDLFAECCALYGVTEWKRKSAYAGVSLGGVGGWKNGWHQWPDAAALAR